MGEGEFSLPLSRGVFSPLSHYWDAGGERSRGAGGEGQLRNQ